jgi:hypothetical protein
LVGLTNTPTRACLVDGVKLPQAFLSLPFWDQRQALIEKAERYQTAQLLQQLITALEQQVHDSAEVVGDRSLAAWMAWARSKVEAIDPLTQGPTGAFTDIAKAAASNEHVISRPRGPSHHRDVGKKPGGIVCQA